MASESKKIAEASVDLDILPQIIFSAQDQGKLYKKCTSFVLRSVAKHSSDMAEKIIENEGLITLKDTLDEYDPSVKEAACWALSQIAK